MPPSFLRCVSLIGGHIYISEYNITWILNTMCGKSGAVFFLAALSSLHLKVKRSCKSGGEYEKDDDGAVSVGELPQCIVLDELDCQTFEEWGP